MMKKFLMWSGKRSHNIQVQAGCALLYGLLSMFGFSGTVAIVMKLRAMKQPRKQNVKLQQTR
jgi:hypothetical protein